MLFYIIRVLGYTFVTSDSSYYILFFEVDTCTEFQLNESGHNTKLYIYFQRWTLALLFLVETS